MTTYCPVFRQDAPLEFRDGLPGSLHRDHDPDLFRPWRSIAMTFKPTWALFLPFVATLFVGVAEELAFRKVMFKTPLKRSTGKGGFVVKPVLISAVVLPLVHAVNIPGANL